MVDAIAQWLIQGTVTECVQPNKQKVYKLKEAVKADKYIVVREEIEYLDMNSAKVESLTNICSRKEGKDIARGSAG